MSNVFCSVRIKKLKKHQLGMVEGHNMRTGVSGVRIDDSATKNNKTLYGDTTLSNAVLDRIDQCGVKIINGSQNASTVAVEMVISASPDFFRENPDDWGKYDPKKVDVWQKEVLKTLKEKYGSNLVRVDLHLDESTPHMHAMITPIEKKLKKKRRTKKQIENKEKAETYEAYTLNAKSMFDRQALVQLQTDIAKPLEKLGIKRGIHGSKGKHKKVKDYWNDVLSIVGYKVQPNKLHYKLKDKPFSKPFKVYKEEEQNTLKKFYDQKLKLVEKFIQGLLLKNKSLEQQLSNEKSKTVGILKLFKVSTPQEVIEKIKKNQNLYETQAKELDQAKSDNRYLIKQADFNRSDWDRERKSLILDAKRYHDKMHHYKARLEAYEPPE